MKFMILALLPVAALGQLLGGGRVGGISEATVDPTSVPVQFAVSKSNEQLAKTSGLGANFKPLQLVEITHARTQVVAGENYFLTLHLAQDYYCKVTVWYRAWLPRDEGLQVTDGPTCTQSPSARALGGGMPGGVSGRMPLPTMGDSDEGDLVIKALAAGACLSNDQNNAMMASTLGDTSAVTYTKQVTAGMTYHFYDVPMVETRCRNNGCTNMHLATCHVDSEGMKSTCEVVVQSQPWMSNPYTLTSVNCQ